MDTDFLTESHCYATASLDKVMDVLNDALSKYPSERSDNPAGTRTKPEIFNTDQGSRPSEAIKQGGIPTGNNSARRRTIYKLYPYSDTKR